MSTAVHRSVPLNQDRGWQAHHLALAVRVFLSAGAVLFSYLFAWHALRHLTADLNIRVDALLGIHQQWAGPEAVVWNGRLYRFVNACTFIDVWFGAVPLLWRVSWAIRRNLLYLAGGTLALFAFNIFRLSLSDLIFSIGVPWSIAHQVVAGAAYCAVWIWIWEHRDWARQGRLARGSLIHPAYPPHEVSFHT